MKNETSMGMPLSRPAARHTIEARTVSPIAFSSFASIT
jgi:hypothetical protein